MRSLQIFGFLALLQLVASQQIGDIWQTTWDRNILFTHFQPTPEPINFVTPGVIGSADIVIDDSSVYQTVYGFGASLTDSSVELLNNLKVQNPVGYQQLMDYLFNGTCLPSYRRCTDPFVISYGFC